MYKVNNYLYILDKMLLMENLSTKLKDLRLSKNLTLKSTAEHLGLSLGAYAHYEQGIREPSLAVLVKICDFFEVSADYLLGRSAF